MINSPSPRQYNCFISNYKFQVILITTIYLKVRYMNENFIIHLEKVLLKYLDFSIFKNNAIALTKISGLFLHLHFTNKYYSGLSTFLNAYLFL